MYLGNLPVVQASAGLVRLGSLESHSISLNAAAGVCVDPVGVSSSEDGGILVGCEAVIVDHRTEVWRLGVSHDPTLITNGGKASADKVVHPHCFGSSDLRYSVDWAPDSSAGHGGGDIVGGDRTEQRVWQPDNVPVCRGIGQANREFVERRGSAPTT